MLEQQGILLLALGHPYYGRMAYNLAMSIKAIEPFTNITLVYTEDGISHLNKRNLGMLFNNMMLIDDTDKPYGIKLKLNELSPYERTLYMDVDTLWINKYGPSKLFEQLKGISFTGITEGFHDYNSPDKSDHSKNYFFWADVDEIANVYGFSKDKTDGRKLYQWRSEFIYFEKNETVDSFFEVCREIYNDHGLKTVKEFAGTIPDELAINIGAAMCNIHPHKYKWTPTYWDQLHGGNMPSIDELSYHYYVISCGSNKSIGALKRVYDRVTSASAYRLKLQHVFPLVSKKEMLLNRQLM